MVSFIVHHDSYIIWKPRLEHTQIPLFNILFYRGRMCFSDTKNSSIRFYQSVCRISNHRSGTKIEMRCLLGAFIFFAFDALLTLAILIYWKVFMVCSGWLFMEQFCNTVFSTMMLTSTRYSNVCRVKVIYQKTSPCHIIAKDISRETNFSMVCYLKLESLKDSGGHN